MKLEGKITVKMVAREMDDVYELLDDMIKRLIWFKDVGLVDDISWDGEDIVEEDKG